MNTQPGMKRIIKLVIALAVIVLAVRWCSSNFGNVINLPGGSGKGSTADDTGGWINPNGRTGGTTTTGDDIDIKDLERELGVGNKGGSSSTINIHIPASSPSSSSTSTSLSPLTFKGIPMSGTLSAFGSELVKAGFRSAGNGTYTGDFAGYSGCKVTPSGSPVQEVRVDFPVISDWDALEKAYDSLQASLTQKYGMEPKTSQGSNVAIYDLPGGTITLDADVKDRSTWHVILKYSNALSLSTTGTTGRNPIDDL